MNETKRILAARITTPHGVRGEMKCQSFLATPEDMVRFAPYFELTDGSPLPALTVVGKSGAELLRIALENCADRNTAEQYKGAEIWLPREYLPDDELAEGEYYLEDLVGLRVLNEAGTQVGTVVSTQNYGASDLLEVKDLEGKTELYAFTPDNFPKVDIASGTITITPPEILE